MGAAQFDELAKSMKVTAGSRFNAAKYLETHDRNLTWVTAFTSVYIITITIIPYFWSNYSGWLGRGRSSDANGA